MKLIRYFSLVLLVSIPLIAAETETAPKANTDEVAQVKESQKTAGTKYVVVDAQKIIAATKLDKDPVQKLVKLQQKLQKELTSLGEDIQKEEAALKKQASADVLSADAFKEKQEKLEDKKQQAQAKMQRANKQIQEEEMNVRVSVFQELHKYAQELVDSNGIGIMFEKNGGILAYAQNLDSSDALSKKISADLTKKEAAKKKAAEAKKAAKKKADSDEDKKEEQEEDKD